MKKITRILLIILIFSLLFGTISFAGNIEDIVGNVSMQAPPGGLSKSANYILDIIQWIAYAIAVGMLIMLGVKYTMAVADQRADLKTSAVKYIAGAIIIAAAPTLIKMIYNLASDV